MADLLELSGRTLLDVGCGEGALLRALARPGLRAYGLDSSRVMIEGAARAPDGTGAAYFVGAAEALPLPAASFDVVVFFNSLHHIPVARLADALGEAARVLRPGGQAYIQEPLAEGPYFDLVRPVEDETRVRAAAYRAIEDAATSPLFRQSRESTFLASIVLRDFAAFRDRVLSVDPARRDRFLAAEPELEERFHAIGETVDCGRRFLQPTRINLLRRRRT
jgi:ubiquinone/menaquinone biosynthesis C-methylase UbiE